jgi:hypothetical protein
MDMGSSIRRAKAAIVGAGALIATAVLAAPAQGAVNTLSNPTPITIPAGAPGTTAGPADPYPSTIDAAGLVGTIADVDVTLSDFSHTFPADVGVLLVGPGGQSVIPMGFVGEGDTVTNLTLTFDDEAAGPVPPGPLTSGTFQPTDLSDPTFTPPAPAGGRERLSVFDGTSPNGSYSLFVEDFAGGDVGTFAGGWSLVITTFDTTITKAPKAKTFKKQSPFEFNAGAGVPAAAPRQAAPTFECSFDGRATFRPCTSPTTVRAKPGKHIFSVQATVEGVTDTTPATVEWKVKKKKPKK